MLGLGANRESTRQLLGSHSRVYRVGDIHNSLEAYGLL